MFIGFRKMQLVSRSKLGFTRTLQKCNSDYDFFAPQATSIAAANNIHCTDFSLAINVQTEIIGQKIGVWHSEKYTITSCIAKMKFNAQKGHEWMTVTFTNVYGNDVR